MNIRLNLPKTTTTKIPSIILRAFKPVATTAEQSQVDAELRAMAKRHQAVSLFAPTFKSWNR